MSLGHWNIQLQRLCGNWGFLPPRFGYNRVTMSARLWLVALTLIWNWCLAIVTSAGADSFRIATYNLNNYLDAPVGSRPAKSPESKAKVRQALTTINADVLALQEVGTTNAFLELRKSLADEGLEYPHGEYVRGFDTNINVAVLSRFPITARRPHTNQSFLLYGRRFRVGRGFAEVDIQVNPSYAFTLITAHLKSRREVPEGDQQEIREQEAILLREVITERLKVNRDLNLVVLGDFNDVKDSASTRTLIGRGALALVDTRPAERNGDDRPDEKRRLDAPRITWTYYYAKEDSYDRVDYILLSKAMAKEWNEGETYAFTMPNWGIASDHRPIVAGFWAENRP